jgi:hypothetical protein
MDDKPIRHTSVDFPETTGWRRSMASRGGPDMERAWTS